MNLMQSQDTKSIYQKQLHFYTLTTKYLKKYQKTNSIYSSIKIIKNLGMNLIKMVRDLYTEIYNTLMKDIEEDVNR